MRTRPLILFLLVTIAAMWSQAQTQNGTLCASERQSPSGNNGIAMSLKQCASQSYACMIQAPAIYAQTEAQPFGASPLNYYLPLTRGPASSEPVAGFMDQRYGVPQWIFNESVPVSNRFLAQPTFAMNNINGPGQGLSAHYPNALKLINMAFANGRNMFNMAKGYGDKTNFSTLELQSFKYTQAQGGGDLAQGVYCMGNGDCAGHTFDTISYGGPNTKSDEGNESMRFEAIEGGQVFGATVASISTGADGSDTFSTTAQTYNGFQGEGRLLIDLTRSYNGAQNSNYISLIAPSVTSTGTDEVVSCAGNCNWDSTFGDSTKTTLSTAVGNGASASNTFPKSNVILKIASSTGFTGGATACIFDYDYECERITAVGTDNITVATLRLPHLAGAYVTTGGLAGYSIEFEADRVSPTNTNGIAAMPDSGLVSTVRNAIPIIFNSNGNQLTLFQGGNTMPGAGAGYTGRSYKSAPGKGGSVTLMVLGRAVTSVSCTGGAGYILNIPLQVVATYETGGGSAPTVYTSTTGVGGALRTCGFTPGSNIATATSNALPTNPYDIYPSAKVTSVYNAAAGAVDGTFHTELPSGTFAVNDAVEEPHYFYQHMRGANNVVGSYIPSLAASPKTGLSYTLVGLWDNSETAIKFNNSAAPTVYAGYPLGTPWVPGLGQVYAPYGIEFQGSFNTGLYMRTPPYGNFGAAVEVSCYVTECKNWTKPYYLLGVTGWNGTADVMDGLSYNPSTRAWVISGSSFSLRTSDGGTNPIVSGVPTGGNSSAREGEQLETPHGMTTGTAICQSTAIGTDTCSVPFTIPYSITITGFNLLLATPATGCATYPDLSFYDQTSGATLISVSPKDSAQGPFSASGGPWKTTAGHTYNVRWTRAATACATNLSGAYYSLVW